MGVTKFDLMTASLADQMVPVYIPPPARTLAVALGANLPSPVGDPCETLKTVRPILENDIKEWLEASLNESNKASELFSQLRLRWSPLFQTKAVGNVEKQPSYINAVLVIDGPRLACLKPSKKYALELLRKVLNLERKFGRDRNKESTIWGPRTLDIDLLAWGDLQIKTKVLKLPHPRLIERDFVIIPLAAALSSVEDSPQQMRNEMNWPE